MSTIEPMFLNFFNKTKRTLTDSVQDKFHHIGERKGTFLFLPLTGIANLKASTLVKPRGYNGLKKKANYPNDVIESQRMRKKNINQLLKNYAWVV